MPHFDGEFDIIAGEPEAWLASFVATHGLVVTLRTTLATYPGSVHWHLKKPGQTGVLEFTWSAKDKRTWFKVAKNRSAEWIDAIVAELRR
ncbi:MAG: hypothetical protein K1X67_08875 [Fimbriimonadaceae bacterium]|nr:hypothetical protein [Fimbriimonadaceae bacterium]